MPIPRIEDERLGRDGLARAGLLSTVPSGVDWETVRHFRKTRRHGSIVRMKKTKSGKRSSAAKGSGAPKSVGEYFAAIPEPARSTLSRVRAAIRSAAPAESTEAISYGIPAFKYKGRPLVWIAAFSDHCSLFPTASVIDAFKNEL